jgi:antitoxin (DNA-binding transcriptional repressor) of toxin-antitoxin stability system
MRTITSRELKNNPALLASGEITLVTSRGKPVALCLSLKEGEDPASLGVAILSLRGQLAQKEPPDKKEVRGEITAVRVARRKTGEQP